MNDPVSRPKIQWVDYLGNPVQSSGEVTVAEVPQATITQLVHGECLADLSQLRFRHPDSFSAGELHHHLHEWNQIVGSPASPQQTQVLNWIANTVSIFDYFQPFSGNFKNNVYNSDRPPSRQFRNNYSCQAFAGFVRETLLKRLDTGAITLLGRVGEIDPPHLVLPLTVEPSKPRLCHDARFLNLWMRDVPFSLDTLTHLPRYVTPDSYQTILDDKSGYDHILLTEESRTFFGIRWGGWFFLYNTLPFGWKISPYVYHSTGLMASNFFRSIGIPCSLYIDDRHNGQLQVQLHQGAYATLVSRDERNFQAAQTAIFLVAYYLIRLGYFLALSKSILKPQQVVPYLGFLSDSLRQAFLLLPEKKKKFVLLVKQVLTLSRVPSKTLQRLAGKCISFALTVPAALLFTREMHLAISKAIRSGKPVPMYPALKAEISHWLFLETWDDPLPWRDEKHVRMSLASDASASGWGAVLHSSHEVHVSDYWKPEEQGYDIATKEAAALDKALLSFATHLKDSWVDAEVDNQAVVFAWHNQGGRSSALNHVIKSIFRTTLQLNIALHLTYIPSATNPADAPSRRMSTLDSQLHPDIWQRVQRQFGGPSGHTCDLMALDSNAMTDLTGNPLPHFTPYPSPNSHGVNLFAQELQPDSPPLDAPYVFPPLVLVEPVLRFLADRLKSCTFVTLDVYPRKYWWPLLQRYSTKAARLACKDDAGSLLVPSRTGWLPHKGLPGDLWVFSLRF